MPSRRRPQARRGKQPRAKRTRSTPLNIAQSERASKARSGVFASAHSRRYRARRPSSLSAKELEKRAAVLAAHSDMMRDRNLSASRAARNNGVTIHDYRKYIPKAFKKDSSGRIRAVADRYLRRLEIPGPDRPIVVKIRGYKAKSEMARFRNDVFSFLGGDQTALNKWKGVRIQGHELLTDPRIIRVLGEQDNLPEHFGSEQVIPYSSGAS